MRRSQLAFTLRTRDVLDQAKVERILVQLALVGTERGYDDENEVGDAHGREKEDADDDEHEYERDNRREQHSDLEVQGLFALIVDLRKFSLLDLPHNERADDISDRNDEAGEGRKVAEHRPRFGIIRGAGRGRAGGGRAGVHGVRYVRMTAGRQPSGYEFDSRLPRSAESVASSGWQMMGRRR